MTKASIRTLVRRLLNETVADNWADTDLDTYINLAYALVLKQVRKVDAEAVLFWDYRNTVVGVNFYEKPAATRGPIEVGLKSTAAATDWTPLTRMPYHLARDWTGSDTVYCHRGLYLGIFPAPTVAVVNGIQFIHAPTDTLAVDTDVPKLETTLHHAIVLWATLLAKGESPQSDTKESAELQRILGDIPQDYGTIDHGQPVALDLDVADARGQGATSISTSNGVDQR